MDSSKIRKEITTLINSLNEHSVIISGETQVPRVELEILIIKIKNLYENLIVFNYLNQLPGFVLDDKSNEEDPLEKEETSLFIPTQGMLDSIEASTPLGIAQEMEELKSEVNAIGTPDLFGGELPPVIEKPKHEKKLVKKEVPVAFNKIQNPAIIDINNAIGINDKFRFASELFAGNMQEYNIAIHQLNTAETLESAMDYFCNLQQLYEWDSENNTVKQLLGLVDRRYS